MKTSDYKSRLFELLPQLYHIYDEGNGSLKAFLEAVGETLDDMERNIRELYGDSFIETCNEWVVPYLGQLIGAKLLDADGNGNRREVMKTIRRRKRKGNLAALEELAEEITGWGARAAEFFEQAGWSQNLNHLKLDHTQSPDLRDLKALARLGTADNRLLHTIDLRTPCGKKGWFQTKNIGFFLSPTALSHYRKIPMQRIAGQPWEFTLEPKRFPVELFDNASRFPLAKVAAPGERIDTFGTGQSVDIYSQGILTATPEMPKWTGSTAGAPPHAALLNLKDKDGLLPVDWKAEGGEPLEYIITSLVLFDEGGAAKLTELGHIDLSGSSLIFKKTYYGGPKINGKLVIRITPTAGFNRAFPAMALRLQSESSTCEVFAGDRRRGIYQDRMYCYLPGFCPAGGGSLDVLIDRYGSAYHYTHDGTKPQPDENALYHFTRLARATEGTIYPSRKLTASTTPFRPIYSLATTRPIQIVDRGQFLTPPTPDPASTGWTIKAWNRDNQPGGGVLRLLSIVTATSLVHKVKVSIVDADQHSVAAPGHLVISLHHPSLGRIPEMELVLTDERGTAVLAYLPQIDDLDSAGAFFYVADDGATYRVNGDPITGGTVVLLTPRSGPGGAFNPEFLARFSAGQVLPIEGRSPIQQRIAVQCDLSKQSDVQTGLLVIDPMTGRIKFPKGERPKLPLAASYYHGLSSSLGAGPYFHGWEQAEERSLIRVSKKAAPGDVRHLRPPKEGIVSNVTIYSSIEAGISEAIFRSNLYSTGGPFVVQIEDSELYAENITIDKPVPGGLVIRAAEFQRPRWQGSMIWKCLHTVFMEVLSFQGLLITRTPEIQGGRIGELVFQDCTLMDERLILNDVKGSEDRYPKLTIDNCIIRDRISVHCPCEITITNSALDPDDTSVKALVADESPVRLERCTVTGEVRVKELSASETIFTKTVIVANPQKGCVRYCRINEIGDTLPVTYNITTEPVTFCNDQPWNADYLKLKRTCGQAVCSMAENGGELGVYHQANYTLKTKNLMLKFEEYLPAGLTPVLIDTGCD